MPKKPNYNFQKRQKEAAKAKRKAEKLARKRQKKEGDDQEGASPEQGADAAGTPAE